MGNLLLIIAHTPSANTVELVQSMASSCTKQSGLTCRVLPPLKAQANDVLAASGILLFTPENFGYMCGAMKDFLNVFIAHVWSTPKGCPIACAYAPDRTTAAAPPHR